MIKRNKKIIYIYGYTLVELLMVIMIFTVISVLAAFSISYTLRGSKKSESSIRVKNDIDYAMSIIERNIRNAKSIISCSSTQVNYVSEFANSSYFECSGGTNNYIASGSARLTGQDVFIDCSVQTFECDVDAQTLNVNISGRAVNASTYEGSEISSQTKIIVRNYTNR